MGLPRRKALYFGGVYPSCLPTRWNNYLPEQWVSPTPIGEMLH